MPDEPIGLLVVKGSIDILERNQHTSSTIRLSQPKPGAVSSYSSSLEVAENRLRRMADSLAQHGVRMLVATDLLSEAAVHWCNMSGIGVCHGVERSTARYLTTLLGTHMWSPRHFDECGRCMDGVIEFIRPRNYAL